MIDRHPGEILERGIDDVIILSDPAYGGIGMVAWNDWVMNQEIALLGKSGREDNDRENGCGYNSSHSLVKLTLF